MALKLRIGRAWVLAALVAMPVANASAEEQADTALQARLDAIESRIAQLEHNERSPDTFRHRLMADLVNDVLADADARASFLDSGLSAGHDGGFFVTSNDGNFHLDLSGFIQFRHVLNNRADSGGDDTVAGFGNRRVRLKFQGHVVDPSWRYVVGVSFSRSSGSARLSDAWIEKDLGNAWSLRAGNFKQPFQREWLMSAKRLQLTERSMLVAAFSLARLPGLQLTTETENTRWMFAIQDLDPTASTSEGFVYTVRGDWQVAGPRRSVRDMTSFPGTESSTTLGGALAWLDQSFVDPTFNDVDTLRWTADLTMEFDGSNLMLGVLGNHTNGSDLVCQEFGHCSIQNHH